MDDPIKFTPEELRELLEGLMKKSAVKDIPVTFIFDEKAIKEFEKKLHEAYIRLCN